MNLSASASEGTACCCCVLLSSLTFSGKLNSEDDSVKAERRNFNPCNLMCKVSFETVYMRRYQLHTAEYVFLGKTDMRSTESRSVVRSAIMFWTLDFFYVFCRCLHLGLYTVCEISFLSMTFSQTTKLVFKANPLSPIIDYLKLVTNMSKRSEEIIPLRDVLTKIPGVTKILWTEMCAIVHDRLEKGKVCSIFFLATRAHIFYPQIRAFAFPNLHDLRFWKRRDKYASVCSRDRLKKDCAQRSWIVKCTHTHTQQIQLGLTLSLCSSTSWSLENPDFYVVLDADAQRDDTSRKRNSFYLNKI